MRGRLLLPAAMTVLLAHAAPAVAHAQVQLGLRLDAVSSVQWAGAKIYLEGDGRTVLTTSARRIDDMWPGPARGAWAIATADGVGVLLGRDVAIGGRIGGPGGIVRSSRYDALWSLQVERGRSRIVEHRAGGLQRTIAEQQRALTDFDVDIRGRIVALGADVLVFIVDSASHADLRLPAELRGAKRVFVDAELGEVAVYAPGKLGRYAVAAGTWTYDVVSETQDALVRHAWSRRMGIEPRFR